MIYRLRHLTTYSYSKPVTFARCALRLSPQQSQAQSVLGTHITIRPAPSRTSRHIGQFGEPVITAIIEAPHRELQIEAVSDVAVSRPALLPGMAGPAWETVREEAFGSMSLDAHGPAQFLYPTAMAPVHPALTAYVADEFTPGRPIVEAAHALSCRIRREFAYDPDSTSVSTPAIEAFKARRGGTSPAGRGRCDPCLGRSLVRPQPGVDRLRPHQRPDRGGRPHCTRHRPRLRRCGAHRGRGARPWGAEDRRGGGCHSGR